jgi:hypothetical protein
MSPVEPQSEFVNKFSAGLIEIKEHEEHEMANIDEKDADIEEMEENPEEDMKDEEVKEDIKEKPLDQKSSDNLQNNPEYRAWLVRCRAIIGSLKLIEKFS